jgi:hypothetical protein
VLAGEPVDIRTPLVNVVWQGYANEVILRAGEEGPTALLSDAQRCHQLFGYPAVSLGTLIDWQADWLAAGLPTLGKPTKFASRDGKF